MKNPTMARVRTNEIAACLTCLLCNHFFVDATKIIPCFHTFCRECIHAKIRDEKLERCPVCNLHLGVNPFEKLRPDFLLQDIRNNAFPKGREKEARELPPPALSIPSRKRAKVEELEGDSDLDLEHWRLPKGYPEQETVFGCESIQPMALFYDNVNKPKTKKIWFTLIAFDDHQEADPPLPQISSRYVIMKDESVAVLYICRFLAEKLGLKYEDEVEIVCLGQPVSHEMRADALTTLWLQRMGTDLQNVGSPIDECPKVLHYRRKVPSP